MHHSVNFSPLTNIAFVWILILLVANLGWPLIQLNVKNVFLHGDLQEEVSMEQPPVFFAQEESRKVCRLHKAIYSLEQSPRGLC